MKKLLYSAGLLTCISLTVLCSCTFKAEEKQPVRMVCDDSEPITYMSEADSVIVPEKKESEIEEASTQNVSTNRSFDFDSEESYMLAKIAMAEAEGESTDAKALVICTVLNRVWSENFPDSIEGVLFQRTGNGGWQFSPMYDGGRWYTTDPNEECWDALDMVMSGWDESQGALYFESAEDPTWHSRNLDFLFKEGNIKFYKEKGNGEQ